MEEAKTTYPWEYVNDKENLWRKYTNEECGILSNYGNLIKLTLNKTIK